MKTFEATLKKYLDIFADEEMYFVSDIRNLDYFKEHSTNITEEDIRMKVSAVNDQELRLHTLSAEMINHILHLQIDSRLQKGDLTVVDDIAQLSANGKSYNLLAFASVYCNLHRPDIFPIYSEQHFSLYRKYIAENKLSIDPDQLGTYSVFANALNHVMDRLNLRNKMNYLQLRKFGWVYAESVLKESGRVQE